MNNLYTCLLACPSRSRQSSESAKIRLNAVTGEPDFVKKRRVETCFEGVKEEEEKHGDTMDT
jgi:hypothetical protein